MMWYREKNERKSNQQIWSYRIYVFKEQMNGALFEHLLLETYYEFSELESEKIFGFEDLLFLWI